MKKTIFLAASMSSYKQVVHIGESLESRGWKVHLPVSAQMMKEKNDFEVSHFKDVFTPEEKAQFIRKNFDNIAKGDAILVINGEKNGVKGYIGANVLMEIGLAFYLGKKIYIWNPVEANAPYKEELLAFNVEFVMGDLTKVV